MDQPCGTLDRFSRISGPFLADEWTILVEYPKASAYDEEVTIIKENGEVITNLYELRKQLGGHIDEPVSGLRHTFDFEESFLHIPGCEPLKIEAIKFEYDVLISTDEITIDGGTLAKAIMIDVFTGERQLYRTV